MFPVASRGDDLEGISVNFPNSLLVLTPVFRVGPTRAQSATYAPALLEGDRRFCVIWYESFRQSPKSVRPCGSAVLGAIEP